ncbi:MAG: hypothetical protein JSW26_02455 [Desulfobacterales bacterium]|nr:MAG: hypothetical protein JSW26_02455 [Desulfobacterales bacterium]
MTDMKSLLQDFVDTHIHAGPTLTAREFSVWQLMEEAGKGGFAAVVLKDHFIPTVPIARALQEKLGSTGPKFFGSLTLNNSVGGINPKAVEVAIGFGAKVIWMPTISAANHSNKHRAPGTKFPVLMKKESVVDTPLRVIGTDGTLTPETVDVLNLLADHPDVVLATGHLSREEVDAVVRGCAQMGVNRVLVTHPHFLVDANADDMQTWQALGAYVEFTAVISLPSSPIYCRPVEDVAHLIKALDVDKIVLSSDLGLKNAGWPIAGMSEFLERLGEAGVGDEDLKKMTAANPARLLVLEEEDREKKLA